jgi:glycosyltransferase involved in cell wall biosynthesis
MAAETEAHSPQSPLPRGSPAATVPASAAPRIVFDMTTTAMWSGPPAGIVRVESQLISWALDRIDRLAPAFFNPQTRAFHHLDRDMVSRLVSRDAAIDTLSFAGPARRGKRRTDRIPAPIRPTVMWVLQARRMALGALERIRLGTARPRIALVADRLQRALMKVRHRTLMIKDDGSRRAFYPIGMVLGPQVELSSRDTLVCVGGGWVHNDIAAIAERKKAVDFRLVIFCHDIIPLMFPHYFMPADVEAHGAHCRIAFQAADLIVFSSRTIEADVRAYCAEQGLVLGQTAIWALGADIRTSYTSKPLPAGLEKERYALLVGTIEPRKGHRLVYDAWLKLLAAGIPQRTRFKLVFVGREGWMVHDLMRDLRNDPRIAGSVLVLTNADDAELATLYRNAAFCLHPSYYEGYGLPIVEALHYGKAILASTGGATPETVGAFSPCLDPGDAETWRLMLQTWIEEPGARAPYEERIRSGFCHPSWDESAEAFFALIDNPKT